MGYLRTFIAAVLCSILFVGAAFAREVPASFADTVEPLLPAVVNISTTQKVRTPAGMMGIPGLEDDPQLAPFAELFRQFGAPMQMQPRERKVNSLGSGFIVDADGLVVTNAHVIGDATDITVTLHDDTKLAAKIIGKDPRTDLALLKVKPAKKLPYVKFGDSDALRVGDWVVAIGNPFGLGGSVTAGIVSARGRNINAGAYDDFIQTDAAINRGNSGGPLFNMNGEVVGINSAIFSPTGTNIGIGFAVPSQLARPVIDQLRTSGHITRGWLGVKIQPMGDEIADSLGLDSNQGAMVIEVTKGGPAARSGLMAGDVIMAFDGKAIDARHSLPRIVADTKVGQRVPVTVWRKGAKKNITVVVGKLPDEEKTEKKEPEDMYGEERAMHGGKELLGLYVKPLTRSLKQQFSLPASAEGLLITGVDSDSDAAGKGLRAGDVVAEANQQSVSSVEALENVVKEAKKAKREFVLLKIMRMNDTVFVTLPVE